MGHQLPESPSRQLLDPGTVPGPRAGKLGHASTLPTACCPDPPGGQVSPKGTAASASKHSRSPDGVGERPALSKSPTEGTAALPAQGGNGRSVLTLGSVPLTPTVPAPRPQIGRAHV